MGFDIEALIRAVIIAIATSLLFAGILRLLPDDTDKRKRRKVSLLFIFTGIALIVAVGVYYFWPTLVKVPVLDNLSEDKAIDVLERKKLVPHSEPRYSLQIEKGRVIPKTQNPPAGQSVKKGKIIEFAIAANESPLPLPSHQDSLQNVSIFRPRSGEKFLLTRSGSGLYSGEVQGTVSGLNKGRDFLLLWTRPIDPPSDKPGWYLQRHPNGIPGFRVDGSWIGSVQVGNAAWPPKSGYIIEIAVSVVDSFTYTSMMSQRGEAMNQEPVGEIIDKSSDLGIEIRKF